MAGKPEDLLGGFRDGDREAVAEVARLARGAVMHRGYYIPTSEREDLVQEIVVHVYRAVVSPSFRTTHGSEAFVRSIAHRRCVDWMRQQRSAQPTRANPGSATDSPETRLLSREQRARRRRALDNLDYSCQQLIRLRFGEELSYRQVAERMGSTEGSVRVRMHNCLKKARALLGLAEAPSRPDEDDEG